MDWTVGPRSSETANLCQTYVLTGNYGVCKDAAVDMFVPVVVVFFLNTVVVNFRFHSSCSYNWTICSAVCLDRLTSFSQHDLRARRGIRRKNVARTSLKSEHGPGVHSQDLRSRTCLGSLLRCLCAASTATITLTTITCLLLLLFVARATEALSC